MLVVDEYLAVRVLAGNWPAGLPDDEIALPAARHWRLLQRVHAPGTGQLSQLLATLPAEDLDVVRLVPEEFLQVAYREAPTLAEPDRAQKLKEEMADRLLKMPPGEVYDAEVTSRPSA